MNEPVGPARIQHRPGGNGRRKTHHVRDITKTAGRTAEIHLDDPHGYLARAVEGDQLAYALEALGEVASVTECSVDLALQAAMHTKALARELDRSAAKQVVTLRENHGLSWGQIAFVVLDDAARQSDAVNTPASRGWSAAQPHT